MISVYLPGKSWAHLLPARLKLLALAIASVFVLPIDTLAPLVVMLLGTLGMYASLGREGLAQLKLLKPLFMILAVILLLHAATGSILEGIVAVARLVLMVLLANFVSVTTRMDDMLDAVMPLFYPLKLVGLNPRRPALAVTLVLRFVSLLMAIFSALQQSYRARTGRRNSWRLIAPFAIQSIKMSDQVAEALSARGGANGLA